MGIYRKVERIMTEERNCGKELYGKMEQELDEFLWGLKILSPEDIIRHSYEKVMKEDFLMLFGESADLPEEVVRGLLEMEEPLDFVYQTWLDSDYGYMDILRDFVSGEVTRVLGKS